MSTYWTVATSEGDVAVRHYPFDDAGFKEAHSHAEKFGYQVWQSFDGEPRYLMWSRRRPNASL